jgi:hypothetical protein
MLQFSSELRRWDATIPKFSSLATSQRSSSLSSASFSLAETERKSVCGTRYVSGLLESYRASHGEAKKAQKALRQGIDSRSAREEESREKEPGERAAMNRAAAVVEWVVETAAWEVEGIPNPKTERGPRHWWYR